jgi:hypothetical protein
MVERTGVNPKSVDFLTRRVKAQGLPPGEYYSGIKDHVGKLKGYAAFTVYKGGNVAMNTVLSPYMKPRGTRIAVLGKKKVSKVLSALGRDRIKEKNFAIDGGRYPIHDLSHARNALARVAQHGSPDEQARVRSAVYRKYPAIASRAKAKSPDKEKTASARLRCRIAVVQGKQKQADFVVVESTGGPLVFADDSDASTYMMGRFLGGLTKYAAKQPHAVTIDDLLHGMNERGRVVYGEHRRLAIDKRTVSLKKLKSLGFKNARISIPEPGRKKLMSWRGPKNLHMHDHGTHFVAHRDAEGPSVRHVIKEGLPAMRDYLKWQFQRKGGLLPLLKKEKAVL